MRTSVVLLGFALGTNIFASETESIKKITALQQTQIQALISASYAVGSIQQSFLTEAEFQAQMGSAWVLCDGRSLGREYENSRWQQIKGTNVIPNCTGRFLRSAGGRSAPLGGPQEQSTGINGLKVADGGGHQTLSGSMTESGNGHRHDMGYTTDPGGANIRGRISHKNTQGKNGYSMYTQYERVTVSGSVSGNIDHSHSLEVDDKFENETRPMNITVNTFIKIN